ncbi:MAG: hypothetical protein WEB00_07075 [Dehalococcoidia bacterium]
MAEGGQPGDEQFPGVDRAYDFVLPSYQWALQRFEAIDSRLQTLQTFSATLTIASPVIVATVVDEPDFRSAWFGLAIASFVLLVATSALARAWGAITVANPAELDRAWLDYSENEFKRNAIYWAGQHFEANARVTYWKGWALNLMTALFLAEMLLLLVWAIGEV